MASYKPFIVLYNICACFASVRVASISTPPMGSTNATFSEPTTTAAYSEPTTTDISTTMTTTNNEATEQLYLMRNFLKLHEGACGFIQLCTLNMPPGNATIGDYDPATCCLPCSCDKSCQTTGTCCPDYEMFKLLGNVTFGNNITDFLRAFDIVSRGNTSSDGGLEHVSSLESSLDDQAVGKAKGSPVGFGVEDTSDNELTTTQCDRLQLSPVDMLSPPGQDYKVVKSCPRQYAVQRIRNLCENPSSSKLLIPVYSRRTGLTYKNGYCLRCNIHYDKKDAYKWQPVLECKSNEFGRPHFRNIDAIAQYVSKRSRCNVVYEPANWFMQSEKCTLVTRSSCTMSDNGDTAEKTLENLPEMCQRFYSPVTTNYQEKHTYRNIACYLCNRSKRDANFNRSCKDYTRTWPRFRIHISLPLPLPKTNLISGSNNSGTTLDVVFDNTATCPQGYMFHVICRKVLCKRGFFIDNGQCVPIYGQMTGITFQNIILVHITDEARKSKTSQQIASIIDRTLTPIIQAARIFKVDNSSFGIFENENGHFYIYFRFTCEKKICYFPAPVDYVKDIAARLSLHPVIRKTKLVPTSYQNNDYEITLYDLTTLDKLYVHKPSITSKIAEVVIPITQANFCYRIKLEQDELERKSILFATLTASKMKIHFDDIDFDEYDDKPIICMDMLRPQNSININEQQMPDDTDNTKGDASFHTPTKLDSTDQGSHFSEDLERGLTVVGALLGLVIVVAIVRAAVKRSIIAAS